MRGVSGMMPAFLTRPIRVVAALLLLVLALPGVLLQATAASASAAHPTVSGPVTGGNGLQTIGTSFDLSQVGYEASEYFISGTATSYLPSQPLTSDGKW